MAGKLIMNPCFIFSICFLPGLLWNIKIAQCESNLQDSEHEEVFLTDHIRMKINQRGEDCNTGVEHDSIVHLHYTTKIGDAINYSTKQQEQPVVIDMSAVHDEYSWEEGLIGACSGELRTIIMTPKPGDSAENTDITNEATIMAEVIRIDPPYHDHHDHVDSFNSIDVDQKDGISWEEMENHVKKYHIDYNIDNEPIETIVSEIFQEEDSNKDGSISRDEYYQSVTQENAHTEL